MAMTDLDPKLTFDNFVVGPANRLACAAARRAADSPGKSYNPLFIYSASGLGKSHILAAVAHYATRSERRLGVLYQAVEGYLGELAEALERGAQDSLRERYRSLDLLLLDDIQFLAGQPQAQEMLLSTLDTLTTSGGQIVLASDRPPAEINGLDSRLVSRFSGGLIVDIAAPEYETRVAIIRKKAEEEGQSLGSGVAEAVARVPFKNVRELAGALNRILAIQDLEGRPVVAGEIPRLFGQAGAEEPHKGSDFGQFLQEIAGDLASAVEVQEEPWRKGLREAAEAAEREGFSARRLRTLLDKDTAPPGWQDRVAKFKADLARLREIESELDRLENPWPEAAQSVVRDPDRVGEAEALLTSVEERQRPFPFLGAGPRLGDLNGMVPPLALKAAEQLVREEKPRYNPLFLWGAQGDAARAILGATARSYRELHPHGKVAVSSVAEFAEDFIRALSAGVAGAWRERWWTVDLLLVHGVEALSQTERAQDEFFHLFEALKRRGSRILLAADRPPQAMQDIDDRLRSRFEGGLALEVTGAGLPGGAADLLLREPDAVIAPGAWEGAETLPEESEHFLERAEPLVPLDAPGAGVSIPGAEGGRGLPSPSVETAAEGPWRPSREKVVWNWPRLDDRIIEDLE